MAGARDDRGRVGGTLPRTRRTARYPLSYAQERLWILDQLEPESPSYNMPAALWAEGTAHPWGMHQSLAEVVRRHGALRTRFVETHRGPVQEVAADLRLCVPT